MKPDGPNDADVDMAIEGLIASRPGQTHLNYAALPRMSFPRKRESSD